jgi:6-phosphogluconate dehydrogenase
MGSTPTFGKSPSCRRSREADADADLVALSGAGEHAWTPARGRLMNVTVGMVGLGRMGGNMSRRLARAGHTVVAWDRAEAARAALVEEPRIEPAPTLEELVHRLPAPRRVWLMLPAGEPTDATLVQLAELMGRGDVVVDGANAFYRDSQRHAADLAKRGIGMVDAGVSGGVWGLENGYGLMVGGDDAAVQAVEPLLQALAPSPERGWVHCGRPGAGHYAKMVHNGIEYGMMQAYAEGLALLRACDAKRASSAPSPRQ